MRKIFVMLLAVVLLWPAGALGGLRYEGAGTSDYTVTMYGGLAVRQFSLTPYDADIVMVRYLDSVALDTVTVLAGMAISPAGLCDQVKVDRTSSTRVLITWNEFLTRESAQAGISSGMSSPNLTVDTLITAQTISAGDSLDIDIGDISGQWEIYVKIFATGVPVDSIDVYFGSSEDSSWASGGTAYFDRDPATADVDHWTFPGSLNSYGTCWGIVNTYGVWLPGPNAVMTVMNNNLVGDLEGLTVVRIMRK